MKIIIKNLEEMEKFGKILAKNLKAGDVISLIGELGAGKTTLVQFACKQLGVDEYVTSPTFSIVNLYEGDVDIYHLDLYRLEHPSELEAMDYERYFFPDGISFIEWAEKGESYLPDDMIEIKINYDLDERTVEIIENNDRAKELGELINENFSD